MVLKFSYICLFVFIVCGVLVLCDDNQEVEFSIIKARLAKKEYDRTVEKLEKERTKTWELSTKQYIKDLENAQDDATKAGQLDEAVKIRDLVATLKTSLEKKDDNSSSRQVLSRLPKGAFYWKGSYYWLSDEVLSIEDSQKKAKELGGELFYPLTAEENDLICEKAKGDLWLDISDLKKEGEWVANGDKRVTYFNWHKKEPNNGGKNGEHVVELWKNRGGQWNDCDDGKKNFYCVVWRR